MDRIGLKRIEMDRNESPWRVALRRSGARGIRCSDLWIAAVVDVRAAAAVDRPVAATGVC